MAKKFSFLNEALNDASKAKNTDTMVDIDDIDPFEFNDVVYPPEQYHNYLDELVEDIRRRGLQQPIELIVNPEDPSRYISIGGNRRCQAIRKLVNEEGLEEFRMVKATISEMTDEEAKENCIMSNNYRDKTNYTLMKEIETLQEIANIKKEKGENITGLRAWLSNRAGLGETQTGKIQRIIKKGSQYLKDSLAKDIVTLEAAAEIASLSPEKQERLIKLIEKDEITNGQAIEFATEMKKEAKEGKSDPEGKKPSDEIKVKELNIDKTWKKIEKELKKLLKVDDTDKELIEKVLQIIQEREEK